MGAYLDRYNGGQEEQVWVELLAYGEQVRDEPLFSDAYAVARSTMARARKNIERLISRLDSLGYEFRYPRVADDWRQPAVFVPPRPDAADRITEFESRAGMLPLSLRAWYEMVGSVDLTGHHPDHPDFETSFPDPLVVTPVEFALSEFADWQILRQEDGEEEGGPFCIDLAPDYYHKAGISGGSPYQIAVPDPAADAPLLHERHATTFVNYLRICFRWGGFPGFDFDPEPPRQILARLRRGLLPI